MDNDIVTWNPVDRGGDSVLVTELQGVNDSQDLSGVSSGGSWVCQDQSDLLLWVDDEDRSDGELDTLVVDVGGVLVVNHVICVSNLSFWVRDDWEGQLGARHFVDVLNPGLVRVGVVGRQSDQLDVSLSEFWLQLGEGSQFSGTDWCEVVWVGEQNRPRVTNVLME